MVMIAGSSRAPSADVRATSYAARYGVTDQVLGLQRSLEKIVLLFHQHLFFEGLRYYCSSYSSSCACEKDSLLSATWALLGCRFAGLYGC